MPVSIETKRRRRTALRLVLLGAAALCLPAYLQGEYFSDYYPEDDHLPSEAEEEDPMARLLTVADELDGWVYRELAVPEALRDAEEVMSKRRYNGDLRALMHSVGESLSDTPKADLHLSPYTIADAVEAGSAVFKHTYGVLVYDPAGDTFHFYSFSKDNGRMAKINQSRRFLAWSLRQLFPERFCGKDCEEFAIGVSGGDYPHLNNECCASFPHRDEKCKGHDAPILNFGSSFRSTEILPNMLAMPMPGYEHITSFKDWILKAEIPVSLKPVGIRGEPGLLHFKNKRLGLTWEKLIPQVVWRGSDFGYLNPIEIRRVHRPDFAVDVGSSNAEDESLGEQERKIAATRSMRGAFGHLWPRWKGVVWSAEAERDAEATGDALPWANIKFYGGSLGKGRSGESISFDWYKQFEDVGIPVIGEYMSLEDLANYKYHIDIGGGGGTTWTGTIEKLAMPGLLFHHVTPTKDYIHYRIKPWYHYIPVRPDLNDLKEKFDWAESHPKLAKMIADNGSRFMKDLNTKEGYGKMVDEELREPLRKLIAAYRPVSESHPGMTWREVIASVSSKFEDKSSCSGRRWAKGNCFYF